MNHHDTPIQLETLLKQVSPEFVELTADLQDVLKLGDNTTLMTALFFKLAQERKQTNELVAKLEQKIDDLSFQLKSNQETSTRNESENAHTISLLPEADQKIMNLFNENQHVDAKQVKEKLGYKQANAASQRLNALVKTGYLGKIQSGRKVIFVQKH